MSLSNARIVLKRGSAVLFGSLSYREQPRLTFCSFSRLIPDPNSSNSSSSPSFLYNNRRGQVLHISQLVKSNGERALVPVRRLEAQGITSKHTEAITYALTDILDDSSEEEMQKEHNFSLLQRETEKNRVDIEKMFSEILADNEETRSELRHDIEKMRFEILANNEETRSELRHDIEKMCFGILANNKETRSELRSGFNDRHDIEKMRFEILVNNEETLRRDIMKMRFEILANNDETRSELRHDIGKMHLEILANNEEIRSELRHDIMKMRFKILANIEETRSELRCEMCENNSLVVMKIHALRSQLAVAKEQFTIVLILGAGLAFVAFLCR